MPRLNDWAIVVGSTQPYGAPEQAYSVLAGYIYDDKRFTDGTYVTTSRLEGLTLDDEGKAKSATTRNTMYTLGAMNTDFARFMAQNNVTIEDYAKKLA